MRAIRVHEVGGPEVLKYEECPVPTPGAGQALIQIEAIGVNYIDTYHREGLYPAPLPFSPGVEAAGIVEAIGSGVEDVHVGDRVAYCLTLGSYAEKSVVDTSKLISIPAAMDHRTAAALMVQGLTAHYLACDSYPLRPGTTALVHAAAGGVGLLFVQIAKRLGARVIGTVSTEAKAELARGAGADEVVLYSEADFEAEVQRLTDGQGVEVVYDSVGQATFEKSLGCLKPRGYLVLFGQSSGPVSTFDPQILNQKGSLFLTRPTLADYSLTREELSKRANDLLTWHSTGELDVRIGHTFQLAEAQRAHQELQGRRTTGKVLLIP